MYYERLHLKHIMRTVIYSAPAKKLENVIDYVDFVSFPTEFVEDVDLLIRRAERCLEAGADMIMIDADDVCNVVDSVRTDIIAKIIGRLGLERTMFEASNPRTSEWFINQYGPRVCLYIIGSVLLLHLESSIALQ